MWPPARRGHRGLRPGGNAEGWGRYALSFFKIDRIHHFDIHDSIFDIRFFRVSFTIRLAAVQASGGARMKLVPFV